MGIGVNEQVVRKERKLDLFLLPVLPYPYGLDYRTENLVIKICKCLTNQTLGSGTQVKYMPFLLTYRTIPGYGQPVFANFIIPDVRQSRDFLQPNTSSVLLSPLRDRKRVDKQTDIYYAERVFNGTLKCYRKLSEQKSIGDNRSKRFH